MTPAMLRADRRRKHAGVTAGDVALITLLVLGLGYPATASDLRVELTDGLLTIEARDVTLGELLAELCDLAGLGLETDQTLIEPVDIRFGGLTLENALHRILTDRGYPYGYARPAGGKPGTLWIFSSEAGPTSDDRATEEPEIRSGDLVGLRTALADESVEIRLQAVSGAIGLGSAAADTLADAALFDEAAAVRSEAFVALGEVGDASHLPILERGLADPDGDARSAAVQAMAEIGGDEAAWALLATLGNEEISLCVDAVVALGEIGGEVAVRGLEEASSDSRRSIRQAAEEALARLDSETGESRARARYRGLRSRRGSGGR